MRRCSDLKHPGSSPRMACSEAPKVTDYRLREDREQPPKQHLTAHVVDFKIARSS